MKTFYVKIKVEKTFEFDDEIEAVDEADAEAIAKAREWRGDYQKEERTCGEIVDESYDAEEQEEFHVCPLCEHKHSSIDDEVSFKLVDNFYEKDMVIHEP